MSADNFILIRRHPDGGYVNVMGWASTAEDQVVGYHGPRFFSLEEAIADADQSYTEYGWSVEDYTAADRASMVDDLLRVLRG